MGEVSGKEPRKNFLRAGPILKGSRHIYVRTVSCVALVFPGLTRVACLIRWPPGNADANGKNNSKTTSMN